MSMKHMNYPKSLPVDSDSVFTPLFFRQMFFFHTLSRITKMNYGHVYLRYIFPKNKYSLLCDWNEPEKYWFKISLFLNIQGDRKVTPYLKKNYSLFLKYNFP